MEYYDKGINYAIKTLHSDAKFGLSIKTVGENLEKYGLNKLTAEKKRGFFSRLFNALKEPMLVILIFGFAVAFGSNLGKLLKTGEADFSECFGILAAILLSVSITLIMEGSSQKAFDALNKIYDNVTAEVIRDGKKMIVEQRFLTVGDIVILSSGDKIVADGRLIESNSLTTDESALTGESAESKKDCDAILARGVPLAERKNCVYSGTFVAAGNGKMIVTATGDNTEMGAIAGELKRNAAADTPLNRKLAKLGKTVSIIGCAAATIVFVLSAIRLASAGTLDFDSARELFISSVVLIVAAVPEGLPTVVAVSLALNMIKLAKENALIKKMTATETAGAVSVICSDKTGTLTQNKMSVKCVCGGKFCVTPEKLSSEVLLQNFVCNSSAEETTENGKTVIKGGGTEKALLDAVRRAGCLISDYKKLQVIKRVPFSSDIKYMTTTVKIGGIYREFIKGAPEVVAAKCDLSESRRAEILKDAGVYQKQAARVICFAHKDFAEENEGEECGYTCDGFAVLVDPIRTDVKAAVEDCKAAGIKVKMLTGDDGKTAFAVAKQLKIADSESAVVNASELEGLSEPALIKALGGITVIARSTPIVKLRVVRALKAAGEVVAVTGDGINDAPAVKHADVGFAMGKSGSEITKEAADVVLLDDGFSTVVKAVAFGRSVYKNLQRFILFQLSVNVSALLFITIASVLGFASPFNTLQLLWVNVIMDGPPALTLGLEPPDRRAMKSPPVKRDAGIINAAAAIKIAFNGIFIGGAMTLQFLYNFMRVSEAEKSGATFTLFILFQLVNAFNCREAGAESILKSAGKNKIMAATFAGVFLLHFIIITFFPSVFGVSSLSALTWIKCVAVSLSVLVATEIGKAAYRLSKRFNGNGERIAAKIKRSRG